MSTVDKPDTKRRNSSRPRGCKLLPPFQHSKGSLLGSAIFTLCLGASLSPANAAEVEGEVQVNSGYLNQDGYRFGNYAGVKSQGAVPFLDFNLRAVPDANSGDTGYWRAEAERLGLGTGRLLLEAGQQGTQRLRLDYRGVPTYAFDDTRSPMRGAGRANPTLPQGWQVNAAATSGMLNLNENLVDVNLRQRRHSLVLDYKRVLNPAWTLNTDFRRDRVTGTRALGAVTGATGGNSRALLLPAPIDYETHIGSLGMTYGGDALRWHMGYQGSFFRNGARALSWPTVYGQHPQWAAGTGFPDGINQLALEPGNQAHQIIANGSLVLPGSMRLSMDAALGRQTQNDSFLPYSINPMLIASEALPRTSLAGRVDTSRLNLRFNARPLPRLNLAARLGYRERDNRTPIEAYQRIRGDAVPQQSFIDARLNRPYGLRETRAGSDAAYRLSQGLRLEGGYEYTNTERDFQEIIRMEEQTFRIGLRNTSLDSLALSLDYRHLRRRAGDYVGNRPLFATHVPGSIDAEDFENHSLLRKYNLSDRDRDQWRLQTDWYPTERLSFGTTLSHNRDQYPSGFFGLNHSEMLSATLDSALAVSDDLRLSAFINREQYRNRQSGRSFRGNVPADVLDPARNWQLAARDSFVTFGASVDLEHLQPRLWQWQPPGQVDLSLQMSHSRSHGDLDPSAGPGLASAALPSLETRLDNLTLSARYYWASDSSVRLALERERYRSEDFGLGIAADAVASVLLMGQAPPHYRVTWLTMSYQKQF